MKAFDEISLFGTRFHKLKVFELIDYIVKAAKLEKKTTICHVNVRGMNFAYEIPWYKDFINKSDLVFCDGFGVLLGAKICGCNVNSSHRMTCPDYIENLALSCERENVSLFLLAGKAGTVDKAIAKLQKIAPNLKLKGHHGYFDKSGEENEFVIKQINEFKPDVLYIGFGMPLQEQWIRDNLDKIDAKVFLPLGACLDFYTDTVYRGPRWMTNNGLEWLARLFTEPQRLWSRYIVGNPLFFYRVLQEWFSMKIANQRTDIPVKTSKPDLRSVRGTIIQRGLAIKFLRILTLILLDIISLTSAWKLVLLDENSLTYPLTQRISFLLLILTIGIGMIGLKGLYKSGIARRNYFGLIKAITLSNIVLLMIALLNETESLFSYSNFIFFWVFSVAFTCIYRKIFDVATKLLRNQGVIRYPVIIITEQEEQQENIKIIEQENCYTIQQIADSSCLDLRNRDATFEYIREQGISEAFVSWNAIKNRLYVIWNFHTAGITLRILPNYNEVNYPKSEFSLIGDMPCVTIPAAVIAGSDFWVKRCFDICCSATLLFILSPLFFVIAILIKLDSPGPVFFRQNRVGLHGKDFQIWKFRTMVTNAEKLQATLEAKNEIKDGVLFKIKDDPRITKVGKFLRLYSLDELPQLLNVLFGQMSLVGPRPLPKRDVTRFQTKHFIRQEVLPGITGLWQVSGRSDIDNFEDGVKLDIKYIENWSLWLDLKILLSTIRVVLQKNGAY